MEDDYWFPWYPTRFKRNTQHLSIMEEVLYRRMIDYYMTHKRPFPNDDHAIAKCINATVAEWQQCKAKILPFFQVKQYTNPNNPQDSMPVAMLEHCVCMKILKQQEDFKQARSNKASVAAKARWAGNGKQQTDKYDKSCSRNAYAMLGDATISKKVSYPLTPSLVDNFSESFPNLDVQVLAAKVCQIAKLKSLTTVDATVLHAWLGRYEPDSILLAMLNAEPELRSKSRWLTLESFAGVVKQHGIAKGQV